MMVPRPRLIVLTALVLLPATLAAALYAALTPAAWAVAVLFMLATLLDASTGKQRFADLTVTAPELVRLTVDQPAKVQLHLQKPGALDLELRLGLALPEALRSEVPVQHLHLARGHERLALAWPCRAQRRGRFALEACHLEISSRWGLWGLRRRFPLNSEIRVYPNLVSGQKHILGLFSRREWGWRSVRKVGKGREFEQLREYLPGDSYEDVDWKATARRHAPVTRVYQVEQSQEIYVVLDASRLSTRSAEFGRDRRRRDRSNATDFQSTIFERYIIASLVMALAADRAGDRFGLVIFGARPDCLIKAGRGRTHYNACREALYNRMPRMVSPDFDELFTFIGTHLRKRALLLFLTHLDDPLMAEGFVGALRACARQHVVRVNMFRPVGAYPLFSSPGVHSAQGIYEHLAGHMAWSALSDTHRRLRQYGAELTLLDKEQLSSQLIGQYMEIKQRQLL
ncbi:MAG: DUF58 domain-containing protein [Desulfobacterales bacterium]|nr:DUF58 domain-containing protein [Desulfobacterales bacterium]